jgi:hypothetical protein
LDLLQQEKKKNDDENLPWRQPKGPFPGEIFRQNSSHSFK